MASKPWHLGRILFGFALLFWIGPAAAAEPNYPQLTGRIVDDANLLSPDERAELDASLKALEDKSSDQLVVVTLPPFKVSTSRISAISSAVIGASAPRKVLIVAK